MARNRKSKTQEVENEAVNNSGVGPEDEDEDEGTEDEGDDEEGSAKQRGPRGPRPLTAKTIALLRVIGSSDEPISTKQLREGAAKKYVFKAVLALAEKGLVRTSYLESGRRRGFELTDAGRAAINAAPAGEAVSQETEDEDAGAESEAERETVEV